jgi:hypothetical protein
VRVLAAVVSLPDLLMREGAHPDWNIRKQIALFFVDWCHIVHYRRIREPRFLPSFQQVKLCP